MTRERQVDKIKVCGESVSHLCTDHVVYKHDNSHFLLGESHRYWVLCIWAARHSKTLNSQLEAERTHSCRGFHASCRSPVCSGCSWPSPSLVGRLANMGVSVQGERPAHRHAELHRDVGRKGGSEESVSIIISVWVFFGSQISLIPTLFCLLLQLSFLIFSTGSGVAQKVTQDQPYVTSQTGQSVILNCRYEVRRSGYTHYLFWYKQLPSGEMTLCIRQESSGPNASNGRYSVNFQRAQNSISLTISAL